MKKRFKLKHLFIIILLTLLVFLFINIKSIYDSIINKGEVKTLMTIDGYLYITLKMSIKDIKQEIIQIDLI